MLDDYSRFIPAWELKAEQTAEAISDVVQQAVEWTGMSAAQVETLTARLNLLVYTSPEVLRAGMRSSAMRANSSIPASCATRNVSGKSVMNATKSAPATRADRVGG